MEVLVIMQQSRAWTDAKVAAPLQLYMLHHLPLRMLAQLKGTCTSFRQLVDLEDSVWRGAASAIMAESTLPLSNNGHSIQR